MLCGVLCFHLPFRSLYWIWGRAYSPKFSSVKVVVKDMLWNGINMFLYIHVYVLLFAFCILWAFLSQHSRSDASSSFSLQWLEHSNERGGLDIIFLLHYECIVGVFHSLYEFYLFLFELVIAKDKNNRSYSSNLSANNEVSHSSFASWIAFPYGLVYSTIFSYYLLVLNLSLCVALFWVEQIACDHVNL